MTLPLVTNIVGLPAKTASKPAEPTAGAQADAPSKPFDPSEGAEPDTSPSDARSGKGDVEADAEQKPSAQLRTGSEPVAPPAAQPVFKPVEATVISDDAVIPTKPSDGSLLPMTGQKQVVPPVQASAPDTTVTLPKADVPAAPPVEATPPTPKTEGVETPKLDVRQDQKPVAQPNPDSMLAPPKGQVAQPETAPAQMREAAVTTPPETRAKETTPVAAQVEPQQRPQKAKPIIAEGVSPPNRRSEGEADAPLREAPRLSRDVTANEPRIATPQLSAGAPQPQNLAKDIAQVIPTDAADTPATVDKDVRGAEPERLTLATPRDAAAPRTVQTTQAIAQQMTAALSRVQDGTIQIRLDPPELGRLSVTMPTVETGGTAVISADRPEVLDLIRRNEHLLQKELQSAGFANLDLSFSEHNEQGQNDSNDAHKLFSTDQSMSADLDLAFAREGASGTATLDSIDIRL